MDPPSPSEAAADISSSARRSTRRQGTVGDTEHSLSASLSNTTTRRAARDAPSKKGNCYETPELGRGYARGRARRLPQNLDDIAEEPPSPGVAAAASTLVYTKAYGASVDNEEQMDNEELMEDDDEEEQSEGDEEADLSDADYSGGLLSISDEDVVTFDVDSEDQAMKAFPRNKSKIRSFTIDGPQPPDLDKYPENERDLVWEAYKKKRKAFDDQQHKKRAKLARLGLEGHAENLSAFKGSNIDRIRTMEEVEDHPLMANQTFFSRDILYLRVAEEATFDQLLLRLIDLTTSNSL